MRTSEEIYHQIRWDPRFDPAKFVLGVNVRGAEPKRVPLPAFVPGGDIPWHRIMFVEADGETVWDRATGLDVVNISQAGRAEDPRKLNAPFFTAGTPLAWDPLLGWSPAERGPAWQPGTLRVLTWNALWDRYFSERIDTARRRPLLVDALERANADVLSLQEVEADLLDLIQSTPWVRDGYTLCADDIGRNKLLVLSRVPIREAGLHAYGPYKALSAITLHSATHPIVLATTHLTSDHAQNGPAKRESELATIVEGLLSVDADVILIGDFNDDGHPEKALGMRDAWSEIHGSADATPTYDPTRNPLAAIQSLGGRPARIDRVLLRGPALRPTTAILLGDSPAAPDGLFLSDHYGLAVDINTLPGTDALEVPSTARTAIAWIPPSELWPTIQEIRAKHDPQIDRWPPHITLMSGFIPESAFEEAAPLLTAAASTTAPFTAQLHGVHAFHHRNDSTVWLAPGTPDPWTTLRHALEAAFPACRTRDETYTPHLTLGKTRNPDRLLAECHTRLPPMSAHVGELVLLSRRANEPMRPRATITLGTGELHWITERAAPNISDTSQANLSRSSSMSASQTGRSHSLNGRVEDVVTRLEGCLSEGAVHVVGSRRLGCALPGADLDLVVALPGVVDLSQVEMRVAEVLPEATGTRRVIGARVPGLRMRAGGLDIDLVVVGTGSIPPGDAVARRTELDEPSATALSAVSDADAILAAVAKNKSGFITLARQVKGWARTRGLDSAPFGGLSGLAWTILAARTVIESDELPPGELLQQFFATWAAWDWHEPIALGQVARSDAPIQIMTATAPVRPCSDQVSIGGRDLLTQELYRAWETTDIDEPPPLHRRHAAWAIVTIHGDVGKARGRMRALLAFLERAGAPDAHAWPRPFHTGPRSTRYAIGLGRTPPDTATITEIATRWTETLPGVTVTRAEGGDVPTLG
ncbi:hypothetical protein Acor_66280 [Acrocarpospora corrugata]|uniref:Polynucleotide adenylyltransferase n=1 Tax=Acrocarpospora corrugata TaxID=35763 RepID=A0A5M3W8J4_9ACTN|nr:poly(A) polymerase [Acrocarpospora corrugata]GES04560.1 hypothetical protein Acor_66280 [Acrocarpospora corrugata]